MGVGLDKPNNWKRTPSKQANGCHGEKSSKGKWETSGSKNAVKNGDTITITIDDKTVKGTVRQISSKFVKGDPNSYDSAKPKEDRTITTYSVNLGALGTYTYTEEQYLSDK